MNRVWNLTLLLKGNVNGLRLVLHISITCELSGDLGMKVTILISVQRIEFSWISTIILV